jgi:hypothetical protein
MFKRAMMLATMTASAMTLGACDGSITTPLDSDGPEIAASEVPVEGTIDLAVLDQPGGDGSLFDQLAAEIPGFAGFWFDRACNLNVVLTRPDQQETVAIEVLTPYLRRHIENNRCRDTATILVHQGEFDWTQLSSWLRKLGPALSFPGVERLGISIPMNRIVAAVTGREAANEVLRLALDEDVPSSAIKFTLAGDGGRDRQHDRQRDRSPTDRRRGG